MNAMTCTPLNITDGDFINDELWDDSSFKPFDGKTLTFNKVPGPTAGISIQQGQNSIFHQQLTNHTLQYRVLGTKYLVILDIEEINPPVHRLYVVNFTKTPWDLVEVLEANATPNHPSPVNRSQGEGSVFLASAGTGDQLTSVGIYRSDNGDVLCSLGTPITPTGETAAKATPDELIIHYSTGNVSHDIPCARPKGKCEISPPSQTFSDVFVGGCSFTPPTKQFTIKNIGDDCLTVNSIANNSPFNVKSTSAPLPTHLAKNEIVQVVVEFNPAALGNWTDSALMVSTSPVNGDNQLICNGKAIVAQFKIQFNSTTFNFGKHSVGTSAPNKTLTITNNGSKPLSVNVPILNVSGFACAGFNGTLSCGQSQNILLHFTPSSEGSHNAILGVVSDASGSPHMISLLGEGCIANAEILVPPSAPIDFGQIQQGFRTVRIFEVENPGDGPLTFKGSVTGTDAALFGLPDPEGSVTDASSNRTYAVLPVAPCGTGTPGSGKVLVAVSFYADTTPKLASATLTLSSHNAANLPASKTWTFPLSAEIIPPVALDVALVVDRSESMNDMLGSRRKMEAAISASQLFIELLRPDLDDRVAVTRFNHMPDVVSAMSAVSSTISPTQNDILQKVQTDIEPAIGNTAIAGGALTGIKEVQKPRATSPPKLTKAVVVLSDGIENTGFEEPPGSGKWFSILGGQMDQPPPESDKVSTKPISKPSGINIYAVGLGHDSEINTAQLTALAGDQKNFFHVNQDLTGAKFFELEKYYTQIYMDIVETSSIKDPMYWISPEQEHVSEFDVLRGDTSALVVIYDYDGDRLPFYCISPRGEIVDPAIIPPGYQLRSGFTRKTRFVEFKMPFKEPDRYAGRWKVVIKHPGQICKGSPPSQGLEPGFLPTDCIAFNDPILYGIAIGVGSNFRMMPFVSPEPVYVGEPILLSALVIEAGLRVSGCQVTVSATSPSGANLTTQLFDDGVHSDGEINDGEYARSFTHTYEAGTYHFRFKAVGTSRDGEPVTREAMRDKPVLPRVPNEPVDGGGMEDECCKQLVKAVRDQTEILRNML